MEDRTLSKFVKQRTIYIVIAIVSFFFYLINDASPLRCDDLVYQFMWLNVDTGSYPVDLNNRIDNFHEAIISQINHYQVMNGRFVVHLIVQCFCGFLGKPMFNIINAIVYALFLVGSIQLLKLNFFSEKIFLICVLWLILPIQYILSFDIAFAVNYLWVATACIYYIIWLEKTISSAYIQAWWKNIFLLFGAFICGSSQEGFTIPLSASVFIYSLINLKKLNSSSLCLIIGLWLGTALVVFAPGTLKRGNSVVADFDFMAFLHTKMQVLIYSKRFLAFLLLAVIVYLTKGRRYITTFMYDHALIIGIIVFNLLFVIAFPRYNQRLEFPLELMSVLLSVFLVTNSDLWEKTKMILCSFVILGIIIHMPLTVYYARLVGNEYCEMIEDFRNSPQGEVYYRDFVVPKPFASYVIRFGGSVEEAFVSFTMGKEIVVNKNREEATKVKK